jgi:pyrroloquinoline quinone (PQQ) biosynthesis protein C
MGRGKESGMHGPMLSRLGEELNLSVTPLEDTVVESLALANLLVGLAISRPYAYHSVGALGAIELTAPDRAALVYQGLKRLNFSPESQRYYLLHSTLDKKHAETWLEEVIKPLVTEKPLVSRYIAEGALMRLNAGARCFARYKLELFGTK